MRPKHTHQSADHFLDFLSGFNLPAPCTQGTRGDPEPAEDQSTDLTPGTNNHEAPRLDDNKVELTSKVSVEPRKSTSQNGNSNWTHIKRNTSILSGPMGQFVVFFPVLTHLKGEVLAPLSLELSLITRVYIRRLLHASVLSCVSVVPRVLSVTSS
jgi:hypothetical protein